MANTVNSLHNIYASCSLYQPWILCRAAMCLIKNMHLSDFLAVRGGHVIQLHQCNVSSVLIYYKGHPRKLLYP